MTDEWIKLRVEYIDALKKPSEPQQLLSTLYKVPNRTRNLETKLKVLAQAERAAEKFAKAQGQVAAMLNDDKRAAAKEKRIAQLRELEKIRQLLSMADLIDAVTGRPKWDDSELLGGLLMLAKSANDECRRKWREIGNARLTRTEYGTPTG